MKLSVALLLAEMLFVNLFYLDACCTRRYSKFVTGAAVTLFAFLIFVISQQLFSDFGNGEAMIGGLVFVLPLSVLYREKLPRLFLTACMCWAYTLAAFVLAMQAGKLIPAIDTDLVNLLAQTALYLLTFYPFYRWVLPKYRYIIRNLDRFDRSYVRYFGLNCFLNDLMIWGLHLILLELSGKALHLLVILLYAVIILISYLILYRLMRGSLRIRQLEQISLQDPLTGLGNRARLTRDLRGLLEGREAFSILFMDLDRFKEINDRYGHLVGDRYLQHFADVSARILENYGQVYRFGGDEFIALCPGGLPQQAYDRLRACREWDEGAPCAFNQVSAGKIDCHPPFPDVLELLHEVDSKMYEMKKARSLQV